MQINTQIHQIFSPFPTKKSCFTLSILLLSLTGSFAQNYEKGYIIDHNDNKIECAIDNKDRTVNPATFNYRLNDQIHTGNFSNVKEFGVYGYSAYEKYIVKVAYPAKEIEDEEAYLWTTDTLFLKVTVKGNPSLYTFTGAFSPVFFYKTDKDAVPQQLKHKVSSKNTLQFKPRLDYKYVYANSGIETAVFNIDKVQSFSFSIGTGINREIPLR